MTKLKISGSYGDSVKLHLEGYVFTKYSKMLKISSVDLEKKEIICFGDKYDFSRISGSCKADDEAHKEYLETINHYFQLIGIKVGSIVNYNSSEMKVTKLFCEQYFPYVFLEDDNGMDKVKMENFIKNPLDILFTIIYTPFTLKEKLTMHLDEHVKNCYNQIDNKEEYIDSLLELLKKEKV